MEDLTGKQFGAYQIVAPLGEGGMAAVYKAYQPAMERYVALKVLPRHFADDAQFVARFQREAKLLAQLQHPHILPVFDYGQAEGYTYIVMPFVQSGTLTDSLKGLALPLSRIRQVISQIGDALNYAHTRGLIHRDVKPSNVLIDEGGNCLLTDFGLARMVEASVNLTTSGTIMGTPAYMSPEQGSGQKIDARSDIYSLGIILYEMATGRVPYKAETPVAVIFKHIQDPLPPASTANPDLPEAVERVILKSLSKSSEDRYQTASDMVRAIQAAIQDRQAVPTVGETLTRRASITQAPTLEHQRAETRSTILAEKPTRAFLSWAWAAVGGMVLLAIFGGLFVVFGKGANSASQTPAHSAAVVVPAAATIESTLLQPTRTLPANADSPTSSSTPEPAKTSTPPTAPLSPTPNVWVVAKGGEDLLQLAGWSGCGDYEGGEFTITSSQENYCGMQNGEFHLEVKGAWGIKVVLEIGPQRNLDNTFGIGNGLFGEGSKEIGIGLNPTQLRVFLGTDDGSYFNNSFDAPLNDGPNEVEVHSFGDRFELYINGQKLEDIPDPQNTFDNGRVYFGAFIGPPQGYFTVHTLSALVPVDHPNNVTISTSP